MFETTFSGLQKIKMKLNVAQKSSLAKENLRQVQVIYFASLSNIQKCFVSTAFNFGTNSHFICHNSVLYFLTA